MIASLFAMRARNLAAGIKNLLAATGEEGWDEKLYDHPLIKSLYRPGKKPSYIPASIFALSFIDGIVALDASGKNVIAQIKAIVSGMKSDSELKRLLCIFLQQAGEDFTKLQAAIETWFNDSMSRVAGWYKRKSQVITIILALLVTGATNADTLLIVKRLYTDSALRAAVIAQAQEFAKQQPGVEAARPEFKPEPSSSFTIGEKAGSNRAESEVPTAGNAKETLTLTLGTLQRLGIPLGWEATPKKEEWVNKIIGLLLTALAVSLGAPFWFDVLSRVTKIRSTGTAPMARAQEEKKGDTA